MGIRGSMHAVVSEGVSFKRVEFVECAEGGVRPDGQGASNGDAVQGTDVSALSFSWHWQFAQDDTEGALKVAQAGRANPEFASCKFRAELADGQCDSGDGFRDLLRVEKFKQKGDKQAEAGSMMPWDSEAHQSLAGAFVLLGLFTESDSF